jgi:hypothetical protein
VGAQRGDYVFGRVTAEEAEVATYQGRQVTVVRPARKGDAGFKDDDSEQVIVKLDDGTEKCVAKAEVKG